MRITVQQIEQVFLFITNSHHLKFQPYRYQGKHLSCILNSFDHLIRSSLRSFYKIITPIIQQDHHSNHLIRSVIMQSMQQKRKVYCGNELDRIPITRTNITVQKKPKQNQFDFSRISQIDQLLNKNELIYKNLRKKLEDIGQASRNITNNINHIRPASYATIQKSFEAMPQNYDKFFNDSVSYGTNNFDNFASSSIQTERPLNESLRRRIDGSSNNILIVSEQHKIRPIIEQESEMKESSIHEFIPRQQSQQSNFKRTNTSKNRIYLEEPRRVDSQDESLSYNYFMNITKTTHNNQSQKFLPQGSFVLDKQVPYVLNRSYEPIVDSIVRSNFNDLSRRRSQIEKIYQQLRKEEEEIQRSYQQYKKNFNSMHEMSTKKQESILRSLPKNNSPKKSFDRKSSPSLNMSKLSLTSKNNDPPPVIKQTKSSFNQTEKIDDKHINQASQILSKLDYSPRQPLIVKYCTQEFQTENISSKPQQMTAHSHVFLPFNKLYKSPIIQMKNKNTLILARQSKQVCQKTFQNKIIDGKKFKFQQNIETDEQQLIKGVLTKDQNIIAIVGGQQTLKKKLHMAIIAHSVDKLLKIINSTGHDCLSINLSYREYTEKEGISKAKIHNSFEIKEGASSKLISLEVEKTIEEIYEAIKRPPPLAQSTSMNKSASQLGKDKGKVVKFTKIQLLSGKDYIWICHVLSTNQISFEFLKNLQVKDIIWSLNPLIKHYEDVSKTLNEANRYIEAKLDA